MWGVHWEWDRHPEDCRDYLHIYVCLIPMFPLHFEWVRFT